MSKHHAVRRVPFREFQGFLLRDCLDDRSVERVKRYAGKRSRDAHKKALKSINFQLGKLCHD